jgi:hypothetical protein
LLATNGLFCWVFLVALNNFFYLWKFHKLINRFEGHFCFVIHVFIISHLVHVVWANWANDLLALLVVPHLLVFVKLVLVQFIKEGKWSWSVNSLLFVGRVDLVLNLSMLFGFLFLFDFFSNNKLLGSMLFVLLVLFMLFVFFVFFLFF